MKGLELHQEINKQKITINNNNNRWPLLIISWKANQVCKTSRWKDIKVQFQDNRHPMCLLRRVTQEETPQGECQWEVAKDRWWLENSKWWLFSSYKRNNNNNRYNSKCYSNRWEPSLKWVSKWLFLHKLLELRISSKRNMWWWRILNHNFKMICELMNLTFHNIKLREFIN